MRIGYNALLLVFLIIGLAVGASFGGGIVLGRNTAKTPTPAPAAAAAFGGQGAAAGGTATGGTQRINLGQNGASGAAGATIGTVESVQGDTVTVRGSDGTSTQYTTSPTTQVSAAAPSSISAIKQGDLVQLGSGQPDASGHQTTRSILVLPARQGTASAGNGAAVTGTPGSGGAAGTGSRGRGSATAGARRSATGASSPTTPAIEPPTVTPIPVPSGTPINP